jgi:hypothetical protein
MQKTLIYFLYDRNQRFHLPVLGAGVCIPIELMFDGTLQEMFCGVNFPAEIVLTFM